jgi:MFS family permease
MTPVGAAAAARQAEPVLTRLVDQDEIPWYRKRNLRRLYALLLPTCIGIEMTSGFDSQMINTVQIAPTWQACKAHALHGKLLLICSDFHHPHGALLGIISAAYNLGAVCSLPLVPYVNDRFGRRWAIFIGSWIMVGGSIVQALSNTGMESQ